MGQHVHSKHGTDQSIMEAEVLIEATAWSGSTPQVLAGLLIPSTSLDLSSVLDDRRLLVTTWLHEKPV